jgi:hypothetical protein
MDKRKVGDYVMAKKHNLDYSIKVGNIGQVIKEQTRLEWSNKVIVYWLTGESKGCETHEDTDTVRKISRETALAEMR